MIYIGLGHVPIGAILPECCTGMCITVYQRNGIESRLLKAQRRSSTAGTNFQRCQHSSSGPPLGHDLVRRAALDTGNGDLPDNRF